MNLDAQTNHTLSFSVDVSAAVTRDSLPTCRGSTKEGGYQESVSGVASTSTTENHVHGHHVWDLPSIQTGKRLILVRYVLTDNITSYLQILPFFMPIGIVCLCSPFFCPT